MSPELMDSTAEMVAPHVLSQQPNEVLVGKSRARTDRFVAWDVYSRGVYRCEVILETDETGGFTVFVPGLPGVASQGDTEADALENIREALAAALATYLAKGQSIPWVEEDPTESSGIRRWVVVHV